MQRPNLSLLSLSIDIPDRDKNSFQLFEVFNVYMVEYLVNLINIPKYDGQCIFYCKGDPHFKLLNFGDKWVIQPDIGLDKLKRMFLEELYGMMHSFSHRKNSVRFRLVHTYMTLDNGEKIYIYAESFDCKDFILNVCLCNDETEEETTVVASTFVLEDRTYKVLVDTASKKTDEMLDKLFDFEKYLRTGDFSK